MSRNEALAIVRRARDLLATRKLSQGGPMRNEDGSHATRFTHAKALSIIGALMFAAEEMGLPWAVGSSDEAVAAVHRVALAEKAQKGRSYIQLADWNDALDPAEGHAIAVVTLTRTVPEITGKRGLRAVGEGAA